MKRMTLLDTCVVLALLAAVPLRRAFAYIDPNSAGALYQMLFPLLVAVGSAVAALRRVIARACARVVALVAATVRGRRAGDGAPSVSSDEHAE